jgi:hypothetical protein
MAVPQSFWTLLQRAQAHIIIDYKLSSVGKSVYREAASTLRGPIFVRPLLHTRFGTLLHSKCEAHVPPPVSRALLSLLH